MYHLPLTLGIYLVQYEGATTTPHQCIAIACVVACRNAEGCDIILCREPGVCVDHWVMGHDISLHILPTGECG